MPSRCWNGFAGFFYDFVVLAVALRILVVAINEAHATPNPVRRSPTGSSILFEDSLTNNRDYLLIKCVAPLANVAACCNQCEF